MILRVSTSFLLIKEKDHLKFLLLSENRFELNFGISLQDFFLNPSINLVQVVKIGKSRYFQKLNLRYWCEQKINIF